jgi:hypothetical protein
VILLDFAKAFDKVPHRRLLHKLNHYGIRGKHQDWIASFFRGRTQQVILDGMSSTKADVKSGVPQGSVLGPLLFLIFINDLPDRVTTGTKVKLFADDCILYRNISSDRDSHILQGDLENLQRWEADWLMQFHPSKCQVLHVTNKKKPVKHIYKIHSVNLDEVPTAKYLGVNIDSKLSWNDHISAITKKANSTMGFIQRNINSCPKNTKEMCYKTIVLPLAEYGSVVWDPHTKANITALEKIQRRGARFVCSDYRRTSSVSDMLRELKWSTLAERRARAKVTMIYRIVNGLLDVPSQPYLTASPRYDLKFIIPHSRINCYQKSFFVDGVRLWNLLDGEVRSCQSLNIWVYISCRMRPLPLRDMFLTRTFMNARHCRTCTLPTARRYTE